jgi:hypothetical protein
MRLHISLTKCSMMNEEILKELKEMFAVVKKSEVMLYKIKKTEDRLEETLDAVGNGILELIKKVYEIE